MADKPFTDSPCTGKSFDSPIPPDSAFIAPPANGIDIEDGVPHPWGRYQLEPDQSVALGLEVQQFLNRQALLYKGFGEEVVIYRQKRFGEACACVDRLRNQAQDGCMICYGTGWVGGYDVMGKTAGYIGSNPLSRTLTEYGINLTNKPMFWTLPNVPLRDRDFIVARGRFPAVDRIRIADEPVIRAQADPNKDMLAKMDVVKVVKVSNTQNGTEDYVEDTDFIMTGGELVVDNAATSPPNADSRVLRILGKRYPLFPPDGETAMGTPDPNPTVPQNRACSWGRPYGSETRGRAPRISPPLWSRGLAGTRGT